MPNEISLTAYKCAVCHKVYINRDDAVECEESHKCPCEKQSFYRLGYAEYCGTVFISGVYFEEKKIKLIRNDGDTNYERDSADIKYCPFCGRELNNA